MTGKGTLEKPLPNNVFKMAMNKNVSLSLCSNFIAKKYNETYHL